MKCAECRRLILQALDPGAPPPAAALHLKRCAACRAVRARLQVIESNVPRVPVPPSPGQQRLQQLLADLAQADGHQPHREPTSAVASPPGPASGSPPPCPAPFLPHTPSGPPSTLPWQCWSTQQRWLVGAGGLAAAFLLVILGYWLGDALSTRLEPPRQLAKKIETPTAPPAPVGASVQPLLAQVLECDLELARTTDRQARVAALTRLAAVLQGEAQPLVASRGTEELIQLATLYRRVLEEGVVARAQELPRRGRGAALAPVTQQLDRWHAETRTLAARLGPALSAPLLEMMATAQASSGKLRALMDEGIP